VLNFSRKTFIMPKKKYREEEEIGDEGYTDVECPECDAPITVRFQKGRSSRRLRCPVCAKQILVNLHREPLPPNLIQLK
jgi:ssDNA-binding Zn-finger/Zn-ribbon topoisomerase 1